MRYFTRLPVVAGMVLLPLGGDVYAMPEQSVSQNSGQTEVVSLSLLRGNYAPVLQRYQQLAARKQWPTLTRHRLLRQGQRHAEVGLIRQRLALLGDQPLLIPPQARSQTYDGTLVAAVRRFQYRHGLKVDGIVGPETRRALNVPPRQRLQQLRLNQRRQQQFHAQASARYLQVNIPEYQLRYIDQGRELITMKVIVGRADRPTPQLSSELETLVVHPDWNVPRGIAYKDIVPALKADPDALDRKGLKLVEGRGSGRRQLSLTELDWQRLYLGSVGSRQRFWQAPGGSNPLGKLKFTFPNRYTVYMHGTPQRSLFNEPARAFSSGCIRIEKPRLLAELLVQGEARWSPQRLNSLLAARQTRHFRLPQRLTLYLSYWTAWLSEDGQVHFRHDIYQQDQAEYQRRFSPEG